jgi:hypothetical protein
MLIDLNDIYNYLYLKYFNNKYQLTYTKTVPMSWKTNWNPWSMFQLYHGLFRPV